MYVCLSSCKRRSRRAPSPTARCWHSGTNERYGFVCGYEIWKYVERLGAKKNIDFRNNGQHVINTRTNFQKQLHVYNIVTYLRNTKYFFINNNVFFY